MKYFISFLIFLILSALIITYVKISKPETEYYSQNVISEKKESIKKREEKIFNLTKLENEYNFPAREIFMKVDFRNYKTVLLYKITINANDEYAVFNIRAILDNLNIAYSMLESKKTEIFVLFRSLNEAEKVIKLFKQYKFNIEIKKLIKRI